MKQRRFEITSNVDHMPLEMVKNGIANKNVTKWAYILHDKDPGVDPHYHVLVWFSTPQDSKYVCRWFGVPETQVQKIISEVGALAYLTHANAEKKHRYEDREVEANFDLAKKIEAEKKKLSANARLNEIRDGIVSGKVRGYNIHEHVSAEEYDRFKKSIDNAYAYRENILRARGDENMSVKVIWVWGDAGTGKTRWAKMYATGNLQSYFISGSGSDFLDGYAGQDCLILDDIRPESMAAATMLKLLDNNTRSSVKSRYRNKWLEVKTIIVTCPCSPEDFWTLRSDREKVDGTLDQLLRRIYIEIHCEADALRGSTIKARQFNKLGKPSKWSSAMPNPAMSDIAAWAFADDEEFEVSESALSEIAELGV